MDVFMSQFICKHVSLVILNAIWHLFPKHRQASTTGTGITLIYTDKLEKKRGEISNCGIEGDSTQLPCTWRRKKQI